MMDKTGLFQMLHTWCPTGTLLRLQWERTLKPGVHEMTCQVKDPSDGRRYVLQTYPCANPDDAKYVEECASAQRDFRHPFLCQVREVFRYRYQAFNITGMATESFQQVIVLTEHCGAGELQWHTAGRPKIAFHT